MDGTPARKRARMKSSCRIEDCYVNRRALYGRMCKTLRNIGHHAELEPDYVPRNAKAPTPALLTDAHPTTLGWVAAMAADALVPDAAPHVFDLLPLRCDAYRGMVQRYY